MNDNDRLQDEIDALEREISRSLREKLPQDDLKFILDLSLRLRNLVTLVRKHERELVVKKFPDILAEVLEGERNATLDEDHMLYQAGSRDSFRCTNQDHTPGRPCGCNVFRRLKRDPKRFKCNGCGAIYIKDPDPQ